MIRITGLDQLQRKLEDLGRRAERLDGTHTLTFELLFPDSFVRAHTRFATMQEMIDEGGIDEAEDIEKPEWNSFVVANSNFESWEDMKSDAGAEWAKSQLGL